MIVQTTGRRSESSTTPPIVIEGEEEYEVEKILNKRKV